MARLLIANGVQQGRALRLKPGVNRIGRNVENHLQVPDPSISGVHCELVFSDDNVLVRDLNSTNGTFIDGEQIHEGIIEMGHILQLGNIEMRLEALPTATEASGVSIPELPVESPPISLLLPDGSPGCANHPEVAGLYKCTSCEQALCENCVRIIRRVSGGIMVFCSLCAAPCDSLLPTPKAVGSKRGFFGRLTETLRLPFRGRGDAAPGSPKA
jgi:hypothetical protein